ncbi:alpha/beta-Hydrolase [Glarea lozoyensis ATCC 20868]|uniref:Alpha/beta-Hydrolase n=1 Tax=Glarea lozoyensis (strain ATCC 20868 / MF5171) TaxID=1116229 RepID=S3D0D4_GLAL2|nr:alpha/beta-Hydrolase [Glarea lozoyensis ATCC 20868]EPE31992.1 alpha/beta-Hydrolase [Glarea lozoyensis ATCC 20868]
MRYIKCSSSLCGIYLAQIILAEPLVTIQKSQVTYHGIISQSIEHFQNIKYAHDTSGQRRFSPPESFIPPPGTIVDALSPGPSCLQTQDAMLPFFSETGEISEDCLHLRISRPATNTIDSESKLPVVLWVHGGGVVKGSSYDPHFDPTNLIKLSVSDGKPIIYVAINYRLTIFGFARTPSLKNEKSLNGGMRDQRMAMEWVKENIEDFGGDSQRITAFGLSAGGTFISLHTMAYGGDRGVPFQQAWMMSGPPATALNMTSDATEIHTKAVAELAGCDLEDSKMLQCLRDLPFEQLLKTAMDYSRETHPPADIPIVFGWTQNDGAINAGPAHLIQTEEDMIMPIKAFAHALTNEQLKTLFSLYPVESFEVELQNYKTQSPGVEVTVHYFRLSRILRDLLFTCSSLEFGYQMFSQTRTTSNPNFNNVRFYNLNQSMLTPIWKGAGMPYIGVSHGSDTNYIFNGVFPEGEISAEDQALSESLARSLINFATTSDPDSKNDVEDEWPSAFPSVGVSNGFPSSVKIQVIGGPYGTGSSSITVSQKARGGSDKYEYATDDQAQHILDMGEMDSSSAQMRQRQIENEDLFRRCEYINSLAETLGI